MTLPSILFIILAGFGVFLIGVSKTGFGATGGNLAVPLMALVIPAQESLAILLPVLCIADLFSLWLYKGKWNLHLIKILMPSTFIGIVIGSLLLGIVPDIYLKKIIGLIAVGFIVLQFIRYRVIGYRGIYKPRNWHGVFIGSIAGGFSALAHAAGPILSLFLLPMKLTKETFVATTVVYLAIVNYLKLVPYILLDMFDYRSLLLSGIVLPFALFGVYIGYKLNLRLSSRWFFFFVYILLLVTAIQLLTGTNIFEIILKSSSF